MNLTPMSTGVDPKFWTSEIKLVTKNEFILSVLLKCFLHLIYLLIQILLTMIWLWKYLILYHLSTHFGIPLSCTHRIVHKCLKLLHAYLVPKYITWHTMQEWNNLVGIYPEWPSVVAILDCTPFRISRPRGYFLANIKSTQRDFSIIHFNSSV